jgi:hypothetical protein
VIPQEPERPDFVAAADQAGASLGKIAEVLGQYFASLLDAGFERDEAMDLVRDWHREWLERSWDDDAA